MKDIIYQVIRVILLAVFKLFLGIEVKGKENIPAQKGAIIMSNHISALDPPLLAAIFPRPVRFMAKKELFDNILLRFVLFLAGSFPVDRGKVDISAVKNALQVIKDDQILGIFPEGTRRPEGKPGLPKAGSVMLAIKSKSPILPVGIKNINRAGRVTVSIGQPFTMEEFTDHKLTSAEKKAAAKYIKDKIVAQINL